LRGRHRTEGRNLRYSHLSRPKSQVYKVLFWSSSMFFLFASSSFLLDSVKLLLLPCPDCRQNATQNRKNQLCSQSTPPPASGILTIDANARSCKNESSTRDSAWLGQQCRSLSDKPLHIVDLRRVNAIFGRNLVNGFVSGNCLACHSGLELSCVPFTLRHNSLQFHATIPQRYYPIYWSEKPGVL